MPKRNDIHKILIIGAGPIIISQACEFDYSGTQACKALKEEGFEVVLINSNPATIMTDPETADRVYVEPVNAETLCKVIEIERPDAVLPTLGGQTALNTTIDAAKTGIFERYNIELIGASIDAINKAEDRELFRDAMNKIGLRIPKSGFATNMQEVEETAQRIGFPIIVRPSFTLGGTGGGVAYNMEELANLAKAGLDASLITQVMLEESVLGWKEYELEVMRDHADNVVIICSIENVDAMGVHTGDSITVAPAQTLSDKEYQALRDASIAIIREIGVDTGGSNVQFAVNPDNGDIIVVEMNPRVSRSSALASKATGFPIAKIAAKLAVGYTLDEIPNDITGETMACFEPSIDYCVVKIPRWTFEKFPEADDVLTTAMKSVGETMSIGRTFKEALQKGLRSLEIGRAGFGADGKDPAPGSVTGMDLEYKLSTPNSQRIFYIKYAIEHGMPITMIHDLTDIDPWFLYQMKQIVDLEKQLKLAGMNLPKYLFEKAKKYGFSDMQLAYLSGGLTDKQIEQKRKALGIVPVYKLVDTCAAEFRAVTPYYYSTYESECEARVSDKKKVIILGGGPNRIGQGIEFDYCCVHASFALREEGVESIMVNSNPETVSTDYDTSDKLYFEPLTREDVLHIVEKEKPFGVIVQFGGQTPLNLATDLQKEGVPIIGTSPESIDRAEDRDLFAAMLKKLGLRQPDNGIAYSYQDAVKVARDIGYPVMVRPSFVLGGRAMKIVYDEKDLESYFELAVQASPDKPVLIDKFLEEAFELDVDAISDGEDTIIGGMMEHIEEAGIHSGDSACVLPPYSIEAHHIKEMSDAAKAIAKELNVKGLMNIQFGIMNDTVYIIEVNPRASRTIPFVSKAIGVPLAKLATKVMLGKTLKELGVTKEVIPPYYCVKEAVMPFDRFENVDPVLGPEMKSTGEVMGIDKDLGAAVAKAQFAAGQKLPKEGTVFISVQDKDKKAALPVAKCFHDMGFTIMATRGTVTFLEENKIPSTFVKKVSAGRPHVVDAVKNGEIQLILNTGASSQTQRDGYEIRRAAIKYKIPYATTTDGARAISLAIQAMKKENLTVKPLQYYHQEIKH
ncbi:carbamoyl-phosphate synthase large subunit [Desulfobacter postgatei]|jgi:carbamoyl-phosphate synthase large subunit|uniref:carbamoyl-phosphate synthase large subunit n=1 Tax=Desulfobacter postgatei TaxID=2293 RepID=UPI002A35FCBC|nr:carbamoyl-phosphate synthase large subunit [Desulfobacter postgatei]MDX9964945.1 carbamoyl-phosphate synthase large subunit [Desulfobacter postgatei]